MNALTLPGTVSGLLRRGSPVMYQGDEPKFGVIVGPAPGCHDEWLVTALNSHGRTFWLSFKTLHLDLTDASGRAHAAWWLTGGPKVSATVFQRGYVQGFSWCPIGGRGSTLIGFLDGKRVDEASPKVPTWSSGDKSGACPPLADLDPNDPRLLRDGSRWVDAEALRRVVLHVAGVAS